MKKKPYSKYGNTKTELNGIKFDSIRERNRYIQLHAMEKSGLISELKLQPAYKLKAKIVSKGFPNGRELTYRADFSYIENGVLVVEDVKGVETDVFKIKRALVKFFHDIDVKIVR